MSDQKDRLELLLGEMRYAREAILDLHKTSDQLIGFSVAAGAGAITLAGDSSRQVQDAVWIALPFALGFVLAYALRTLAYINALGGYRRAIESYVTETLQMKEFLWESSVAPALKRSGAVVLVRGIALLGFASTILVAMSRMFRSAFGSPQSEGVGTLVAATAGYSFLCIALAIAVRSSTKAFGDAQRATAASLEVGGAEDAGT